MAFRRVKVAGNYVRLGKVIVHKANILSVTSRNSILKTPKIDIEIYEPRPDIVLGVGFIGFIFNDNTNVVTLSYNNEEERDADLRTIPLVWNE